MYEIRKAGKKYRVYDRISERYVANTRHEEKAHTLVNNLTCKGFEGNIPAFFFVQKEKYGMNLDRKTDEL
jgi:pantothenate kinase